MDLKNKELSSKLREYLEQKNYAKYVRIIREYPHGSFALLYDFYQHEYFSFLEGKNNSFF